MLRSARRAAVATVKPRVSPSTWQRLRSLDPFATRSVATPTVATPPPSDQEPPMSEWDMVRLARHFGTDKWGAPLRAALRRSFPAVQERPVHPAGDRHRWLQPGEAGRGLAADVEGVLPRAEIFGLDLQDKSFVEEPRIRAYQGSQTNEALLRTIVGDAENLQIVVDDGSHRPEHIRRTFEVLFPFLPPGGCTPSRTRRRRTGRGSGAAWISTTRAPRWGWSTASTTRSGRTRRTRRPTWTAPSSRCTATTTW